MDIGKAKNEVIGVYGKKRPIQKTSVSQRSTISKQKTKKEKAIHKKSPTGGYLRCIAAWSSRRR